MARLDISDGPPAPFGDLLRIRAFRVLFLAEIQSLLGDQLARVALAIIVFTRTDSVVVTAFTYALSYLPGVLGGLLLARVGDRLPRTPLLVAADLARVVIFILMALPGTPIAVMAGLVALATFIEPAFSAAQFAYLANVLTAAQLRVATGLRMSVAQAAQVAGFALGGVAVAAVGPRQALVLDALSFALSALLVAVGLRVFATSRLHPDPGFDREQRLAGPRVGTIRWIAARPGVPGLIALSCLVGLFVVPEGLAVPYMLGMQGSLAVTGLLLASIPLGGAIGALILVRWIPHHWRGRATWVMVVGCGLPLVVTAWTTAWQIVFAAWLVSGVLAAYQVEVIAQLAHRVPDERRSSVMGVVGGLLIASQGACIAIFGAVGQWLDPGRAIAVAGLLGAGLAATLWAFHEFRQRVDTAHRRTSDGVGLLPVHSEP